LELSEERGLAGTARRLLDDVSNTRDSRTLGQCFEIFELIHKVIDSLPVLRRVTREVIDDMVASGVVYLELRTTPRALPDGTSKREYVHAVADEVKKHPNGDCVRLILSLDRALTGAGNDETAALAVELASGIDAVVVGLDVSGNPTKGSFSNLATHLGVARGAGLPITVHCGEVENPLELDEILAFQPERLGHALWLEGRHINTLLSLKSPPPIELCPTSNVKTLRLADFDTHPTARLWLEKNYPFCINTDDSGVFMTNAAEEYLLFAKAMGLDAAKMADISVDSVGFGFLQDDVKRRAITSAMRVDCEKLLWYDRVSFGLM
jgi:adenosine deaminase